MAGRIGCAAEDGAMHTGDGWSDDSGAEGCPDGDARKAGRHIKSDWPVLDDRMHAVTIYFDLRDNPIHRNSHKEYFKYTYIEASHSFYESTLVFLLSEMRPSSDDMYCDSDRLFKCSRIVTEFCPSTFVAVYL